MKMGYSCMLLYPGLKWCEKRGVDLRNFHLEYLHHRKAGDHRFSGETTITDQSDILWELIWESSPKMTQTIILRER